MYKVNMKKYKDFITEETKMLTQGETQTDALATIEKEVPEIKVTYEKAILMLGYSIEYILNLEKKTQGEDGGLKLEVGKLYIYTNKKGEEKVVKLLSLTKQIAPGKDNKFLTSDDIEKEDLSPDAVYVQFKDSEGNFSDKSNEVAVLKSRMSEYKQKTLPQKTTQTQPKQIQAKPKQIQTKPKQIQAKPKQIQAKPPQPPQPTQPTQTQ